MSSKLFRKEAMSKYLRVDAPGALITIAPPWTLAVFGTMAALFVALGLFSWLGRAQVSAEARGIVRPNEPVVTLHAPFAGQVLSATYGARASGHAGDALATMDVRAQTVAHDGCAADLAVARGELASLEKRLADWNEVPGKDREGSPALVLIFQIRAEREKVASLKQKCEALGAVVNKSRVVFPVDAQVMDVGVSTGAEVKEGDVLATLMPASAQLVGYLALDERYRAEISVGQPVRVKFDALPYDEVGAGSGRITRILDALPSGVKVDAAEHASVFAEVSIDAMPAGSGPPRAGMTFSADVLTRKRSVLSLLFGSQGASD